MKATNFFAELKRRKVYRVAAAYAIVGWLLIQIATQVFPFLEIPNWTVRLVIVVVAIGFPVALALGWAFDITPTGIKRTDDLDALESNRTAGRTGGEQIRHRAPPPAKSVAVLPFENLSDDRANAYFADGVHDDILSSLSKIADLKVISRTSVQQYRTGARNLREIGMALGVAHIVEGTVRRSGNRVRVNAQLINAETDDHIWAETFDREVTDIFAIQTELAERITVALQANLSAREKANIQVHPTSSLEAYELYLRARGYFHWSGIGDAQESAEKALPLLDQAIALDPKFALAYTMASRVHAELYWFGFDQRPTRLARARAAAEMALQLQPNLGDAHLALAFYYYYAHRDYALARSELALAYDALPNNADVFGAMGVIDRRQGRWNEGVSNLERARQLDPRNVSAIWNLIETYTYMRRYPEAEGAVDEGLAISPGAHFFSLARGGIRLRERGNTADLRKVLAQLPSEFDPGGAVTTIAVRVGLMDRNYDEAARHLAGATREWYNDNGLCGLAGTIDGHSVPRAWYTGLIARGQGKPEIAQAAFEEALKLMEANLVLSPDNASTIMMIGLIQAALNRRDDAIRNGNRAVQLLPTSRDAIDGPILATNLAVIYAQVGEQEQALAMLDQVANVPNGPTPALLRIEPQWDSLRDAPRFKRLSGPEGT